MAGWKKRLAWGAISVAVVLIVAVVVGGIVVRRRLHNSLPAESGSLTLNGLSAPVTVDRDSLGVPTIAAASRADAARALGFVHAQDRFFQMDLQRRQAAGELSALVGARALEIDRASRVHRFRHISQQALAQTAPAYRAILDAYTAGVNAGLSALAAAPIEYLLLRVDPQPWKAEDTILTILTMFNTLQGRQPQFEATFGTLAETMPPPMYDFLTARGSEWDAPMTGGVFPRPGIPGAEVFNLQNLATETPRHRDELVFSPQKKYLLGDSVSRWLAPLAADEAAGLGSNNWAVSGAHTASGVALVANDMHLAISVPNIWYRASMQMPDPRAPGQTLTLTGVTLPGLPSLVVGSNGHVAWGFTNTGGDWSDLVIIEPDPRQADHYLTPGGSRAVEVYDEPITTTAGAEPFKAHWTMWGPIVRRDHRGRDLAQRWVAHDAAVLAGDITAPEAARTLDEVLSVAAGLGIPAQNFVAGDTAGRIGWTIAGAVPKRVGFDGSRPTSWADGSRRWDGYVTGDAFPRVTDPPSGRVWTANSPVVEGQMLATIGEGGYADGIRARVIRDRLMAISKATPADMLSVQLDDSALFHERWRTLLLNTLTADAVRGHDKRAEFRRLVDTTWSGKAEPRSVAYRLVRTFRQAVFRDVFTAITSPAKRAEPDFDFGRANRADGPLWQLISERPAHLLNPRHRSWNDMLLAAVDTSITELEAVGDTLADRTWGEFNRAIVTHPLGGALPIVHRWFNMPSDPLPGDVFAPRAHSPRAGPSERMVVSPGREHEGILHMPTGQSGHPWSPHYADQHRAWVDGTPLPFLPGPSVARLTLTP